MADVGGQITIFDSFDVDEYGTAQIGFSTTFTVAGARPGDELCLLADIAGHLHTSFDNNQAGDTFGSGWARVAFAGSPVAEVGGASISNSGSGADVVRLNGWNFGSDTWIFDTLDPDYSDMTVSDLFQRLTGFDMQADVSGTESKRFAAQNGQYTINAIFTFGAGIDFGVTDVAIADFRGQGFKVSIVPYPIPEPATVTLFAMGILDLVIRCAWNRPARPNWQE